MPANKRPRRGVSESEAASSSSRVVIDLCDSNAASRKTCATSSSVPPNGGSGVEVIDLCSTAGPVRHLGDGGKESAQPEDEPPPRKRRVPSAPDQQEAAIAPYIESIDCHILRTEDTYRSRADFLTQQADVTDRMRAILVDWIVDVHLKFKLLSETLHLAINLLDRYLEKESVLRRKLQLIGCAALFIASKYEEIMAPEARDFVYVSDKAFSRKQLLQMEVGSPAAR